MTAPAKKVSPIPEGYYTATPYLTIRGVDKAIEWYKKAFGAVERVSMPDPSGKISHAEIQIGNSIVMMGEEFPEMGARSPQTIGGTGSSILLYVENVDAAFKRAADAGATVLMPPADMFWGDRYGKLADPFGHQWSIATHIQDLTLEETQKGADAFYASMAQQQKKASSA